MKANALCGFGERDHGQMMPAVRLTLGYRCAARHFAQVDCAALQRQYQVCNKTFTTTRKDAKHCSSLRAFRNEGEEAP